MWLSWTCLRFEFVHAWDQRACEFLRRQFTCDAAATVATVEPLRVNHVVVVMSLAACGDITDHTIDRTFDPCAAIALAPIDASALQLDAIEEARALWHGRGATGLGARGGGDTIEIRFESAASVFRGLYDDEHGVIYINRALTDPAALAIVIAHELGHAFGLVHVPVSERSSLMNPGNLDTPPTEIDASTLTALWGGCE
jgi:hypothetical protein